MENIELTFTQCKQIRDLDLTCCLGDWRDNITDMDNQPDWITCNQSLDLSDIQAIQQGGCASGAYMPAVTYYTATQTMSEHGDDVLQYIEDSLGELPDIPTGESWGGIAVFFLSVAVELWAGQFDLTNVDWD